MSEPSLNLPRRRAWAWAAMAWWVATAPAWAQHEAGAEAGPRPDAQALLAASDEVRNPSRAFEVTVKLFEYRSGRLQDSSTLAVFSKLAADSGQYRSVLRFEAPARDQGKLLLKSGNDLWFFDPASQASVRLSPQQRLLGQASNGDVVTANLARDYRAEWLGEVDLIDGERVQRRCHHLRLLAAASDVTYHQVDYWVDTSNHQPVRARFLSESGRLLKTAYFRKFRRELGRDRATEIVIIDGLDPAWVTVLRYSAFAHRSLPDAWFQKDHLPQFKPD